MKTKATIYLKVNGVKDPIPAITINECIYKEGVIGLDIKNTLLRLADSNIDGSFLANVTAHKLSFVNGTGTVELSDASVVSRCPDEIELHCTMWRNFTYDAKNPKVIDTVTINPKVIKNKDPLPTLSSVTEYLMTGSIGLQIAFVSFPLPYKLGQAALLGMGSLFALTCEDKFYMLSYLAVSALANAFLPNDIISDSTMKAIHKGAALTQTICFAAIWYSGLSAKQTRDSATCR